MGIDVIPSKWTDILSVWTEKSNSHGIQLGKSPTFNDWVEGKYLTRRGKCLSQEQGRVYLRREQSANTTVPSNKKKSKGIVGTYQDGMEVIGSLKDNSWGSWRQARNVKRRCLFSVQ